MSDTFDRACRRAGELSPRARRPSLFACESLESRRLLSSFVYSDLAALVDRPDASSLGDGFAGPVVSLGDIDGDGTTDLLAGNAYRYMQFYTGGEAVYSGAAVISGKTGERIRTHEPSDSLRFGWSIAALGDVDADGVPDYAIGTAFDSADPVAYAYSGASGAVIYTFGTHISGYPGRGAYGTTVAGPGDVNGDGRPDILVSFGTHGEAVLYSGIDGSELRRFTGASFALAGGHDFNGDGTPDFILGTKARQTAYSGASGNPLWHVDQPSSDLGLTVFLDDSADFNGDGHPDPLLSTVNRSIGIGYDGHARLYSGLDGSLLLDLPGPADRGLAGAAGAVQDLNGDGVPEIAASVRAKATFEYGAGDGNGVYVYSGADGELVSILTDAGPATLTPPEASYYRNPIRMAILGGVTAVDLDGDGFSEIITSAVRDSQGTSQETVTLRIIFFDGATLGDPVFEGAEADASGTLVAWGHLGATGFVYNRGRTTFITDLGFDINDRIVSFTGFGSEVLLVVEADGDPTNPIAWYASDDLTGGRAYTMNDAPRTGAILTDFRMVRAVDADDGQVLLEMTYLGATKTIACIFERTPGGGAGDPGRIVFTMESVPIAIESGRIVGLKIDDPFVGVLWNLGETIYIPGLRPVDVYLYSPAAVGTPAVVVGIAERDGDEFPRPYTYTSSTGEFTALPLIDGGSDWNPIAANSAGDVVGMYKRSTGETSIFLTRYVYSGDPAVQTFDVLGSTLIGAPAALTGAAPTIIGLGLSGGGAGPYDIYFRYDDPAAGAGRSAVLSDLSGPGPYHSPADAAFSLSQDGDVLVMRSTAGEILVYTRSLTLDGDAVWSRGDLAFSPGGISGPPLYDTPHFGPIVTWTIAGYTYPFIALAADDGVILIEPVLETDGGFGIPPALPFERYHVRNLTTEIAGSEPIAASLITFLPSNDLRLIAGLAADGDLVMYGLTSPIARTSGVESSWAYANLYDQVLRPVGAPEPHFNPGASGDLIGYVTAWGGLNIAGVDSGSGDVVVFWTAPGLAGWQVANLDDALVDHTGPTGVSHLSVYLTSWGGINIVGGAKLGVYWWAPGLGGSWKFNRLTDIAAGATLRPETITSYVTPWDGLNIAGLDSTGRLWVYWWTPTVYWTAETIDDALPEADAAVERTGRLRSSTSDSGRIDIYARSLFGDPLQYEWSPSSPWALTNLNVVADRA